MSTDTNQFLDPNIRDPTSSTPYQQAVHEDPVKKPPALPSSRRRRPSPPEIHYDRETPEPQTPEPPPVPRATKTSKPAQIRIVDLEGKPTYYQVDLEWTVWDVREEVFEQSGVNDMAYYCFMWQKTALNQLYYDDTLTELGVKEGDTLIMYGRAR